MPIGAAQPSPQPPSLAAQLAPQSQGPLTAQPPSHAAQPSQQPPQHAAQPMPQSPTCAVLPPPLPQPPQLPSGHPLSVPAPCCSVACAGVVLLSHRGHLGAPTSLLPVPGVAS
eukprot:scaffold62753_cov24-Tisochrysis_lutea.AAC.1